MSTPGRSKDQVRTVQPTDVRPLDSSDELTSVKREGGTGSAPEPAIDISTRVACTVEQALSFRCNNDVLIGVLHRPDSPLRRGIVMVVGGGPQYRAGGARQLTLWARALSAQGYPTLRFDYRGMGDSHGNFRGFLDIDDDIQCAIDQLVNLHGNLDDIVLWGECDASSAILLYAHRDPRVKGIVLLNPWVRTEAGQAKALLRFYYLNRLLEPSFWRKLLTGGVNPLASARALLGLWKTSRRAAEPAQPKSQQAPVATAMRAAIDRGLPLTESMLLGLQRFTGQAMLVLSGRDLIAREFEQLVESSPDWQRGLAAASLRRHDLPEGDHTFSSAELRARVLQWGRQWLGSW